MFIYIYKKHDTLKNQENPVTFLFTKSQTFYVKRFFMKFLKLAFIYTKIMTLCVTWIFYIQNPDTSKKAGRSVLRLFFIQKILTFCNTRFSWNFWSWRGGGVFIYKNNTLCVQFLYAKKCTFRYFLYTKKKTFCVIFLYAKTIHFNIHLYLQFMVFHILIPTYKLTYNHINHINK